MIAQKEVSQAQEALAVRCRPSKEYWGQTALLLLIAAYFGGFAYIAKVGPPPGSPIVVGLLLVCMTALVGLAAAVAVWIRRAEIIAEEQGLRWRGLGCWRSATWPETEDFYDRIPAAGSCAARRSNSNATTRNAVQPVRSSWLKTAKGRILVSSQWTNYDALRTVVEQKAANARTSEWGVLGSRPVDDWPRVFHYDTFDNRWSPRIILKICLVLLPYSLINPLLKIYAMLGFVGWLVTLTTSISFLLLFFTFAYIPFALLFQYRIAARRKAQRLTADMEGLRFQDGARAVGATWDEITDFYRETMTLLSPVRYVIVTKQGEFDFLDRIKDARLLKIIISRYAVNVKEREWRTRKDMEDLGGRAARWSGGQEGVGAGLYHYRTRTNRAMMLWLPAALTLMFALLLLVYAGLGMAQGASRFGLVIPSAVSALVFCAAWAAYRAAAIHIDEEGITQYGPFLRRFIAWDKVQDFYINSMDKGIVVGRDARVSIGSMIVDREELEAEIARRAMQSRRRTWERPARSGSPRTGG